MEKEGKHDNRMHLPRGIVVYDKKNSQVLVTPIYLKVLVDISLQEIVLFYYFFLNFRSPDVSQKIVLTSNQKDALHP